MMSKVLVERSLLILLHLHRVPFHLGNIIIVEDHRPFLLHQASNLDSDMGSFLWIRDSKSNIVVESSKK